MRNQASESTQLCVTRAFFLSLLSRKFADRLSSNFHRFVILSICWDTPTVKSSIWQLPIVSTVFKKKNRWFKWTLQNLRKNSSKDHRFIKNYTRSNNGDRKHPFIVSVWNVILDEKKITLISRVHRSVSVFFFFPLFLIIFFIQIDVMQNL